MARFSSSQDQLKHKPESKLYNKTKQKNANLILDGLETGFDGLGLRNQLGVLLLVPKSINFFSFSPNIDLI